MPSEKNENYRELKSSRKHKSSKRSEKHHYHENSDSRGRRKKQSSRYTSSSSSSRSGRKKNSSSSHGHGKSRTDVPDSRVEISVLETPHRPKQNAYPFKANISNHSSTKGFKFSLGYMKNSFFAKRLASITLLILTIDITGLLIYHMDYFDINSLISSDQGGCKKTGKFALYVYYFAAVVFFLGLPSFGIGAFDMFSRDSHEKHKVMRTLYLQFCELIVVVMIISMVLFFGIVFYLTTTNAVFRCQDIDGNYRWPNTIFAFFAAVIYLLLFVQITYFTRFREHIKMQLGVFKEKDQTGNIRSRYKTKKSIFRSVGQQVIEDVRKRLYKAVELSDMTELERVIEESQRRLGTDFAEEMYKPPRIWFGLFAKSVKNPVHLAAYMGNVTALEMLYSAGFDVNAFDKVYRVRFSTGDLFWYFVRFLVRKQANDADSGTSIFRTTLLTPLHCATVTGRVAAVRWLISKDADVNVMAKSSYRSERLPPIFLVEHPQVAEELLRAGANHLVVPDPGFMNTVTVLELAYLKGNYAVGQVLEDWGGDVALTPLHAHAAKNDAVQVAKLLRRKADPNCLGEHGYAGMNQRSPLHWAATMGCADSVRVLLNFDANPNLPDRGGRTPLHWAARHNELEIVRMLIDWDANADLRDALDMNPILFASSAEGISKDVFMSLINAGADVNSQLPSGDTALHIAMKHENRETALALLECGGDIMVTNREGFRPVDCTTSTELQFAVKKAAGNRDVMISYTHSHAEFACRIRKSLEHANITTWLDLMDPTGIGGGAVWREEIARGISNAAVVVCLLTDDYPKSEWCLKELAYAKQVGTPVIAISSENVHIDEELQVYLYTRQIIPFEDAILKINSSNKRKITYEYDDYKYSSQFRFLLDGVRDEIEKRRQGGIASLLDRSSTKELVLEASNTIGENFVFISHGNCHREFVRRLYTELQERGISCYLDDVSRSKDMTTHIHQAKEAILKCKCFIPILSDKSATNELVNDQLAFAEDKGKPILPILLSEPQLGLGQQYTLSRNEIYHFTSGMGFNSSFIRLIGGVSQHYPSQPTPYTVGFRPTLSRRASIYSLTRISSTVSRLTRGVDSPLAFSFAEDDSDGRDVVRM